MAATDPSVSMSPAERKYAFRKRILTEYTEGFFFTGATGQGGTNNVIEQINELSTNNKGESGAYFPMLPNIRGGGIVGDNTIRGRERQVDAYWQKATFDMLANAVRNKGPVSDQKSLIQLRNVYRPLLTDWLKDANEEQAILTASGIGYQYNTDGSPRITPEGQDDWSDLAYAADIATPTSGRHLRWDATGGLVEGDTDAVDAADVLTYAALPEIKAAALNKRITPVRMGGREIHILLVYTNVMARLWRDADFRNAVVQADMRGSENNLTRLGKLTVHDLLVVPYARVFNTTGAASGNKWGSGGTVNGARNLLLGAQALAYVNLGGEPGASSNEKVNPPEWLEQKDDYGRVTGFGIQSFMGWKKVQAPSSYDGGAIEDFSIMCLDSAI